jgi:hypothetical protein
MCVDVHYDLIGRWVVYTMGGFVFVVFDHPNWFLGFPSIQISVAPINNELGVCCFGY